MAKWICENCSAPFIRDKSGSRPIRFCSQQCYRDWRAENKILAGCFKPGNKPWNKNKKGIHLSPATEFKKGSRPASWLPIGSVTIRTDKNGRDRAWIKISEPSTWLERAVFNWQKFYGLKVPKGTVIHHKDRDTLNDEPSNLEALTRAEHIEVHRDDLTASKQRRPEPKAEQTTMDWTE